MGSVTGPLPGHCLAVAGCREPRLTYRGYCAAHGPVTAPVPAPRCIAPLRCYCLLHLGAERRMCGPVDTPESIRLRLAALDEQRRANLHPVRPIT